MNYTKMITPTVTFVTGMLVAWALLPQKEVVKVEKEIELVEQQVVVEKEVVKQVIVEKAVSVVEKKRTVKERMELPDGTVIEREIFESESEQVERIRAEERERFDALLAKSVTEMQAKERTVSKKPAKQRLGMYAGYTLNQEIFGGFTYQIIGPLTVGAMGGNIGGVTAGVTVGIRF